MGYIWAVDISLLTPDLEYSEWRNRQISALLCSITHDMWYWFPASSFKKVNSLKCFLLFWLQSWITTYNSLKNSSNNPNDAPYYFLYSDPPLLCISFDEVSVQIICSFLKSKFWLLHGWILSFCYIRDITFVRYAICLYLLLGCQLCFPSFSGTIVEHNFLNLMESNLFFFFPNEWWFWCQD